MNMKRVEEIEAQLRYATQHQTLPGRWSHNINELIEGVKQQQEQIERYKEALEKISESDETDVFAYGEMCEKVANKALEGWGG